MAGRRSTFFLDSVLRQRELGTKHLSPKSDSFSKKMYSTVVPYATWEEKKDFNYGGIFNLEFSPEGSVLIAACENKSIIMFDPIRKSLVNSVQNAHKDCVNCIRFLDSRIFATCSDDTTIALWDIRKMKTHMRLLQGHSNWVKNIEYSSREKLLVSSGFDGKVFTWDINSSTEQGLIYNKVFNTNGLMRTKLTPDSSKMVISTTAGYLMVIHDLDLGMLEQDLVGFKPNMYRLMQMSDYTIPTAAAFTYLFSRSRKRNRVEFISDFPEGNEAEVLSSLQVHPQGWCVLSRNISSDENSEWSCIHDIQDIVRNEAEEEDDSDSNMDEEAEMMMYPPLPLLADEGVAGPSTSREREPMQQFMHSPSVEAVRNAAMIRDALFHISVHDPESPSSRSDSPIQEDDDDDDDEPVQISEPLLRVVNDMVNNAINMENMEMLPDAESPEPNGVQISLANQTVHFILEGQRGLPVPPNHRIQINKKRLTYFIQEANVGRGFIKELCFSPDGRIICSPFGKGMRLLSFNKECSELMYCFPKKPMELSVTCTSSRHADIVVSSKFSPLDCTVVTGCLNGSIIWYQPYL